MFARKPMTLVMLQSQLRRQRQGRAAWFNRALSSVERRKQMEQHANCEAAALLKRRKRHGHKRKPSAERFDGGFSLQARAPT
jgi:hypothetical protein